MTTTSAEIVSDETAEAPIRRMPRPHEVARMSTEELRAIFLVPHLMRAGKVRLQFTDLDRLVPGCVVPTTAPVELANYHETGRAFFLERRELGAINIGGNGTVSVDGKNHAVETEGCIYVGLGSREVKFTSDDPKNPAKFFLLSCPAHAAFPTMAVKKSDAKTIPLGSTATANQRVIRQYIHEQGIKSCQLVMGYTELAEGSVWNTFPPHTHNRRTEVYFYFDLGERVLAHFMGEPSATRHLFIQNEQAVLSPSWSIHAGCGQGNYKFIWGMAGENQRFDDMDAVKPGDLR
jgi:4-deoxy-L-threo-5-hexosulose-uronate ketol-isomerase